MFMKHSDPEVNNAVLRLCDALCQFERSTGIPSVLIIRQKGNPNCDEYTFRAMSGKPLDESKQDGIGDDVLLESLK